MTVSGDILPGQAKVALLIIARRRTVHLGTLNGLCPAYLLQSLVLQGLVDADGPVSKSNKRTLLRITNEGLRRARLLRNSEGI